MLTTTLPKAWKAFTENKKYLLLIILFEFILLFILVQVHLAYFLPSAEAATRAGDAMSKVMSELPESEIYQLETLLAKNPEFMQAYKELLTYMAYFILSFFAALTLLKAPVWHLAHKSIYKKIPLKTTLTKFILLSLFWFVVVIILFIGYSMATGSTATILPIVSSPTTTTIMYILFALTFYYSQISYALIPAEHTFKQTFIKGTKQAKKIFPAFLVNLLITFIVLTLPFNWIQTKPLIALTIMLLITIPALAFTRIHMIISTWDKEVKK